MWCPPLLCGDHALCQASFPRAHTGPGTRERCEGAREKQDVANPWTLLRTQVL